MLMIMQTNSKCDLIDDKTHKILLSWQAGELARDIFNALTAPSLCAKMSFAVEDAQCCNFDEVRYGWIWYRDRDTGERVLRQLSNTEYIAKVIHIAHKRQSDNYGRDTLFALLSIFPQTSKNELVQICIQMRSDLRLQNETWFTFDKNGLMFKESYDENKNEIIEQVINYDGSGDTTVTSITDMVAYDFRFCEGYRLCPYCNHMFLPSANAGKFCSKQCYTEGCRNRNVAAAATAKVSADINNRILAIRDTIDNTEINYYYRALDEWQILTRRAEKSIAYQDYLNHRNTNKAYQDFLKELYRRLLRWAKSQQDVERLADDVLRDMPDILFDSCK